MPEPLSREQFNELRGQGFTAEQIAQFEDRFQAEAVPKPAAKSPRDDSFGGVAGRLLSSVGEGLVNLPSSMLETARGLNTMAGMPTLGTFGGMRQYKTEAEVPKPVPAADRARVLGEALKSGASSVKETITNPGAIPGRLKEAFLEDPAGTLGNASLALSGSGRLLQTVGRAGKLAKALQTAGNVTNPMQVVAAPIRAGAAVVGKAKIPEFLMDSAIKPQQKLPEEKANAAIKLMLDKGITATRNGRQVYGAMQDKLEAEKMAKLAKLADAGKKVDQGKVYQKAIGEERRKIKGAAGSAEARAKQDAVAKQFRDENSTAPTPAKFTYVNGQLTKVPGTKRVWDKKTPLETEDQKKKTYALHKKKYVGPESSGDVNEATASTSKGIARQQKTALEKMDPTIKPINAEIGTLNDIKRAVKQVKANERRQQVFSLPNMIAVGSGLGTGAAAGVGSGSPIAGALTGLLAGAGTRMLDRSGPKSRLAVELAKIRKGYRGTPKNDLLQLFNLLSQGRQE